MEPKTTNELILSEIIKIRSELSDFRGDMNEFKQSSERKFDDLFGLMRHVADHFQNHEERITALEARAAS